MTRLLPILLTACAATQSPCETCAREPAEVEVSVCVDSAFSPAEQQAATDACDAWTSALCGLVVLRPRIVDGRAAPPECDAILYRVQSDYEWIGDTTTPDTAAFCDAIDGRSAWIVVDRVPSGKMHTVMAHELAHLMGVDHGAGLMSPRLTDSCIDRRAAVLAALKTSAARASRCEVKQ